MRIANISDKELVSDILVSAFLPFKENNSINLVVKQDEKRMERMRIWMGYLFEKAIHFGDVFISNNNKACILLKYPHQKRITFKTILLDLELAHKCIGIGRIFKVLKRLQIANQYYPKKKHIRPIIMGVMKECKGNGSAARLMIELKNKFKDSQLPVIIDVASKRNTQLYQKFGFKIIKKEDAFGFPIYFLRLN